MLYPLSYGTGSGWEGCEAGPRARGRVISPVAGAGGEGIVAALIMQPKSRRIVVKFGSGILAHPNGFGLDEAQFERLVYAVSGLRNAGHEVILVSSGAVVAGGMAFGMAARPEDTATLQACAAVGQTRLMQRYESLFSRHGLLIAQLLLTNEDFQQPARRDNLAEHARTAALVQERHSDHQRKRLGGDRRVEGRRQRPPLGRGRASGRGRSC